MPCRLPYRRATSSSSRVDESRGVGSHPQIAGNVAKSFKLFRDDTKKGHDDGK
jgi:hypothetical protein